MKGQFNGMFPQFNKNWKFHCLDLMSDVSYLYLEMKYENSECQNGGFNCLRKNEIEMMAYDNLVKFIKQMTLSFL